MTGETLKKMEERRNLYNPRLLPSWGQSSQAFRAGLPYTLRNIAETLTSVPNGAGSQAKAAMELIINKLNNFLNNGPRVIMGHIYGRWATENGLTQVTKGFLQVNISTPIPLDNLDAKYKDDFQTHLQTMEVSREMALEIVSKLISMIRPESTKYIDDPSLEFIMKQLSKATFQLVVKIFPDLNDREAKQLFGQHILVADVFESIREEKVD